MFEWTQIIINLVILIFSLLILIKSSNIVSDSSENIARITGLGEMAVGFLILSIVTSLPELAVSTNAINSGEIGIPIGTIFGSNIANIGLILGLTAILAPRTIKIVGSEFKRLYLMMIIASIVPLQIIVFSRFANFIGFSLLTIFIIFSIYSSRTKIAETGVANERPKRSLPIELTISIAGILVILFSSYFLVGSTIAISNIAGINQSIIGATIIAIGTSLPELSVSLASIKKARMGLALGNILGSCITNLTLILGFVLVFTRCEFNVYIFAELIAMLILINLVLWRFILNREIKFGDGILLLLLYSIFIASTLGIQVAILSPESLLHILSLSLEIVFQVLAYAFVGAIALLLGWLLSKG
jgi:cation:H+ antiporter